jgi:hypothetical protein
VKASHVCAGAIAVLTAAADAAADGFIGVTFDGLAYSISPTGAGTLLGPTGFLLLNSMARDGAGTLVTANDAQSGPPQLIAIDPVTGQGTAFHYPFLNSIRALAFAPDGTLYAVDGGGGFSWLYSLDLSVPPGDSSIDTLIGMMPDAVQGLAFAPDGTLYGWAVSAGLVTINPNTAHMTDVNGLPDGPGDIGTLTFGPDGTLYGAYNALYRIDLTTGQPVFIGSGGFSDIRGFEWVPAPATGALLALGALVKSSGRRRRH